MSIRWDDCDILHRTKVLPSTYIVTMLVNITLVDLLVILACLLPCEVYYQEYVEHISVGSDGIIISHLWGKVSEEETWSQLFLSAFPIHFKMSPKRINRALLPKKNFHPSFHLYLFISILYFIYTYLCWTFKRAASLLNQYI